jgi:hypothetical protein
MRCGVNRVLAQVEEVFQPETCRQQRRFLTPAQFMQIVHRMPELFFSDVIVVDQRADIFQQTMNNRFKTFITAGNIKPALSRNNFCTASCCTNALLIMILTYRCRVFAEYPARG